MADARLYITLGKRAQDHLDNAGAVGFLVPPGDPVRLGRAITKVIEDPKLAARMGKAGRRRVLQQFTWDRIAEKTLELYRSVA